MKRLIILITVLCLIYISARIERINLYKQRLDEFERIRYSYSSMVAIHIPLITDIAYAYAFEK